MHGLIRRLTMTLWLVFLCGAGAEDPPVFGLQPVAGGTWNGPYRYETDIAFILNGDVFEIKIDVDDRFRVRSLESEDVFGPFERVPGRILKIQGVAYVLTEGVDPEAPLIRPPVKVPPPPPAMPEMVSPDVNTPARNAVPVDPDPRVPAQPLNVPVVRAPPPSVPVPSSPPSPVLPPPRHILGVFSTFAESTAYEWRISDVEEGTVIDLERELIGVFYRQALLDVSAGLIRDSVGSGPLNGSPAFDEFRLGPTAGDGWRLACRLSGSAWNRDWMQVVYWATLTHTREDWTIPYKALRFSMQPGGGGVTGSVIRVAESSEGTETLELTETTVLAGGGLRFHQGRWLGQVMAGYRLLESIDVKPTLTILGSDVGVDLESTDRVFVMIGGGVRLSEVVLLAEVGLAGRTGVTIGLQYEF